MSLEKELKEFLNSFHGTKLIRPDYTTNSKSYYDYLEKVTAVLMFMSKKIDEYEGTIQEYFERWEDNLKEFPEDVKALLQKWLDDGTLDHIINDTIFNNKVDKDIFDQYKTETSEKINDIEYLLNTKSVILTVGANGQFDTINDAVEEASRFKVRINEYDIPQIIILLKKGFIVKEQVWLSNINLSHVQLNSEDEEVVISRQHIVKSVGTGVKRYPVFLFDNNSSSFKINVLFNMDTTGDASQRNTFYARNGSHIHVLPGKGSKNAGGRNLHLGLGSFGVASGTIMTGAGNISIRVGNNSSLSAEGVDVSGSFVGCGISQSRIDCMGSVFNNCDIGISVNGKSSANVEKSKFDNCRIAVEVRDGSNCSAYESNISNSKTITCLDGSVLNLIDSIINLENGISVVNSIFLGKRSIFSGNEISINATDNSRISIPNTKINRISVGTGTTVNMNEAVSNFLTDNSILLVGGGNIINAHNSIITNSLPINQITTRGVIFSNE